MTERNVWVRTYSHKHGTDVLVAGTEEGALKLGAETIQTWWSDVDDHETRDEIREAWARQDWRAVLKIFNDWHDVETISIEATHLVDEEFDVGDLPPEDEDDEENKCPDCGAEFESCVCEAEPEEPFEDGELKGKVHNYRGIAARVLADDGVSKMTVMMIGDDQRMEIDRDEFKPLKRNDYCGVCGQVGCACDGLDREEENDDDD